MNRTRHAGFTVILTLAAAMLAACDKRAEQAVKKAEDDMPKGSTTQLGKTRDMARDINQMVGNSQGAAQNLANEGMGGGTVVGGVTFSAPKSWSSSTPSSSMRAAEFRVSGSAGEAVVWFTHFTGGQGGDTASNVNRWQQQFKSPDGKPGVSTVKTSTIDGLKATRVASTGTYNAGGMSMGGPAPAPVADQFGIGYIIEGPSGSIFVRIVGPVKTVEAAERDFDAMVAGAKKN